MIRLLRLVLGSFPRSPRLLGRYLRYSSISAPSTPSSSDDRAFCKFLRQAQHQDEDNRSTLIRNLCDEDNAAVVQRIDSVCMVTLHDRVLID